MIKSYFRSLFVFVGLIVIFQILVLWVVHPRFINLVVTEWSDEQHFLETIRLFASGLTLDNLKHYEDMSGPLPFLVYALWGKIAGMGLLSLRGLSILLFVATLLIFHRLAYLVSGDGRLALGAGVLLMLNPYMAGLSFLIFTDMPTLFFLVLLCHAIYRSWHPSVFLFCACVLLSRQYGVFLPIAGIMYAVFRFPQDKSVRRLITTVGTFCGAMLPLMALMVLWGGLCPDSNIRRIYAAETLRFHPSFLVLYTGTLFLMAFPLLLFHMKRIYGNANVLMGSFALSWFYWLMPVRATQYALDIGLHTVGIFDRLLELTVGISVWRDIVFQALFFLGLPVLYYFARSVIQSALKKKVSFPCFMDISILSFFMVMPLSYLAWEKYFLLALPLVLLRVLMIDQKDRPYGAPQVLTCLRDAV